MGIEKAKKLAEHVVATRPHNMGWSWGQGLMGGALSELDDYLNTNISTEFLKGFCDYYAAHKPSVASADTSAPAMITYAMQKKTGNPAYKALTDRVLDYIINEPRLIGDAVNHLGNSFIGKFYPKSIWVDSLMMFSVFPAIYASENGDKELLDIAARQPAVYAKYMMDSEENLWYHSYWVKKATHYPINKVFWGRGNGWVISALPKILDRIGDHPEKQNIIDILAKTSEGLLKCQREDGAFDTVLQKPNKTYRELSATALIADGWLHAVRMGYLPETYLEPALQAFKAVDDAIIINKKGVYMPEISGPTSPLPPSPYLVYKITPKAKNLAYGVAAYLWAAMEYDRISK
ncbi:MAG: glycoside hydrolase family 88 protein [Clostridia bacterium]|nr:glycoside hydrolase family 88 protein [Clostridia bacterium]